MINIMTTFTQISRVLFTISLLVPLLFASESVANEHQSNVAGQRATTISPGNRPPIEFDKISDEYVEPGKIYVKFLSGMEKSLRPELLQSKSGEAVSIGISRVDDLNRQFGVTVFKPMLYELYQLPEKSQLQTARHHESGLHLWYELGLDAQADVLAAAQAFSGLPDVEIAEPVFRKVLTEPVSSREITAADLSADKMTPSDQLYSLQWGFKNSGQSIRGNPGVPGADIEAEEAWKTIQGNPDILVAVIDQGFEYAHPDLQANVWPGIGPEGTSTTAGNHGTHVAGTVAAVSNNGIGVAGTAGGNGGSGTGVKVMSLDIFNGSHGMNKLQLNIYAADHGAVITQNSWGYVAEGVYNHADLDGIDYFNAYGGGGILNGGLTIFAAGNSNSSGNWYPAYYTGAMAVAATNNRDEKSGFSNYGQWIDLAAPGTDIASTAAGSYYWMSGTSMACPHVSGVAALVLSYVPGKLTNQQLWNLLVSTTDNIDAQNPEHAGLLGTGRLNARKAIEAASAYAGNPNPTTYHTITSTAGPGGSISPSGQIQVAEGNTQFFSIAPHDGYLITDVLVNGASIGAVTNYSFTNVRKDHSIQAIFTEDTGISYNIDASSGRNGSISPSGNVSVREGSSQLFTITPGSGYYILDVAIDNVSIGAVSSYTFQDVSSDHTIRAAFRQIPADSYTITATAGANGQITPSGTITLQEGGSQTFVISPDQGFEIADVTVNSQSIGAVASYTFSNVQANHSIHAVFRESMPEDHIITASSCERGHIHPSGSIKVTCGGSQTFTFTPLEGHELFDVRINGSSLGALESYTFTAVSKDHEIFAAFREIPATDYTITATAGANGQITPSGTLTLQEGDSQTFVITPNQGYEITDVTVNSQSIGAVASYTFSNVQANHSIHAVFTESAPETHIITASSCDNGFIQPSGQIEVTCGGYQTFTFTPREGYELQDVRVNGYSLGALESYTFAAVSEDQTIFAAFREVWTDPCLVANLPYLQDFNAAAAIPGCWQTTVAEGHTNWTAGSWSGGLTGTTGHYAYFYYQGNRPQQADLISQPFDFSNYGNITLEFKHRYLHNRSTASVWYSVDGGNNWTLIQSFTSSTSSQASFSRTITALAGRSDVRFRWNFDFSGGAAPSLSRSWSVDDVRVTGTSVSGLSDGESAHTWQQNNVYGESLDITPFPNPTHGRLHIRMGQDVETGVLSLIDMQGRQLGYLQLSNLRAGETVDLELDGLTPGLYFVRLITGENSVTRTVRKE